MKLWPQCCFDFCSPYICPLDLVVLACLVISSMALMICLCWPTTVQPLSFFCLSSSYSWQAMSFVLKPRDTNIWSTIQIYSFPICAFHGRQCPLSPYLLWNTESNPVVCSDCICVYFWTATSHIEYSLPERIKSYLKGTIVIFLQQVIDVVQSQKLEIVDNQHF